MVRVINFAKALVKESVKRLPYILALFIILGGISVYLQFRKTSENVAATKALTVQVKTLTAQNTQLGQQIKDLSGQNNDLQRHNDAQLKCFTNLFVGFINNGQAPTTADVEDCQVTASNIPPSTGSRSSPKGQQAPAPTPQSQSPTAHGSSSPSSPPQSQRPSQPPGLLKQVVNFLGL